MPSEPHREPIEPPAGFEQTAYGGDPENRPEWLVGADDNLPLSARPDRPRPTLSRPGGDPSEEESSPGRPKFRLQAQPTVGREPAPAPEDPAAAAGWSRAASSVPKLTVTSRAETPGEEDEETELSDLEPELGAENGGAEEGGEPDEKAVDLPHEPWWLVAVETLATNRPIQIAVAAVLVAVAAWIFWPRRENQTVPIAAIKSHPERFEGQPVRVRGQVGEVFDVGSGVVFHLHQRRDTMVVFSPNRRPAPRERIVILGTVSTGYLDGTPRVALFESATTPQPR